MQATELPFKKWIIFTVKYWGKEGKIKMNIFYYELQIAIQLQNLNY